MENNLSLIKQNLNMKGEIPPDQIANIMEILSYVLSVALGWIAKKLAGRKKLKELEDQNAFLKDVANDLSKRVNKS